MTKKEFKERCSFHTYGRGQNKQNAIYFDWQITEEGIGFKYGVASPITKKELFDEIYNWVIHEVQPQYYVRYKYAMKDSNRFKAPISLNF